MRGGADGRTVHHRQLDRDVMVLRGRGEERPQRGPYGEAGIEGNADESESPGRATGNIFSLLCFFKESHALHKLPCNFA